MDAIVAPSVLREKWGADVVQDLEVWVKEIVRSEGVSRDEYREILSRLDRLEQGQEGLKEEVYQLRGEMSGLRSEMSGLRSEVNERFDRVTEQFDRVTEQFDRVTERFDRMYEQLGRMNERMLSVLKWTVGTIALFGTLISVLLAVFKFVG